MQPYWLKLWTSIATCPQRFDCREALKCQLSPFVSLKLQSIFHSNLFQENRSAMTFIDKSLNEMTYQPSKRGHFYHQASTKGLIRTVKGFQGLSDLTITTTHHTCLELSKNHWTTKSVCMHFPKYSNFAIFSTNLLHGIVMTFLSSSISKVYLIL